MTTSCPRCGARNDDRASICPACRHDLSVPAPADHRYSGRQAAEVAGISYRQLDYWARTGLLRPSVSEANGSGSRRLYSYNDVLRLSAIRALLEAGVKLEEIRTVMDGLVEMPPLLVVSDGSVVSTSLDDLPALLAASSATFTYLLDVGAISKETVASAISVLEPAVA